MKTGQEIGKNAPNFIKPPRWQQPLNNRLQKTRQNFEIHKTAAVTTTPEMHFFPSANGILIFFAKKLQHEILKGIKCQSKK
jgi:hypothetical protein